MAEHNLLGKAGEDAAVDYLERHDYVIRHRNWRKGHFELDIVAAKNGELIIVESKNPKRYGLRTSSRRRHSTKNQAHCNSSRYIYQVIPNR